MPPIRGRPKGVVIWAFAALTHVVLIGMFLLQALVGHEILFMTRDQASAFRWLADEVPHDALVVAAPETGLYTPAWAGQRVYYGHRFETANAEQRQAQLEAFYAQNELSMSPPPDYVFYGPHEQALTEGDWQPDAGWDEVYQQGTVAIYAIPRDQE